jgi:hypothetical protein
MPSRCQECHSKENAKHYEKVRPVIGKELRNASAKYAERGIVAENRQSLIAFIITNELRVHAFPHTPSKAMLRNFPTARQTAAACEMEETQTMIIAEQVNQYLTSRRPDEVCDSCVADNLGLRHQQANRVTMALGTTSDFTRGAGVCADCDRELITTRRN